MTSLIFTVAGNYSGRSKGSNENGILSKFGANACFRSFLVNKNGGYRSGNGSGLRVTARVKKWKRHDYPWPDDIDPNIKSGHLSYLSRFKPLEEKAKLVTLPFEKPLIDLEKRIIEVRRIADETGLDFSDQILTLESKYQQALKDLYTHLTPIQRLSIARHPNRPTVLDHIFNITEKWIELHGDRAGYDDPAIVTGLGTIEGKTYMFIGHQKGRNTKENIQRNFAMPTPHGYRKALRMMKYADHHGFPIVTFVDTPGAYADLKSEELGQGEAIARNLRTMFGLKVPIITVVTGEGGSGGALAIACANKIFMLENAAFYVASPEACAAILWKSAQAAPKAAEKLRITAQEHYRLKIADGIIPEPLGGAHSDPFWTSKQIKYTIIETMKELGRMDKEELLRHRREKYRHIGGFQEGIPADPEIKRNMKPAEANKPKIDEIELEIENLKKQILESKRPVISISREAFGKLKEDVDKEITDALIAMGLQEKFESVQLELSKAPDQPLSRDLKEKVDKMDEEFEQNLSRPGAFMDLKYKLEKLNIARRLMELKDREKKLEAEINKKVPEEVKAGMKVLQIAEEKLSKGDPLDEDLMEEVEKAKNELSRALESCGLELIGVANRDVATLPPDLRQKIASVNKEVSEEIERVISATGLSVKVEELKWEISKGSDLEKVEKLESEIKEKILSALNTEETLKDKFENLVSTIQSAENKAGSENGRI